MSLNNLILKHTTRKMTLAIENKYIYERFIFIFII